MRWRECAFRLRGRERSDRGRYSRIRPAGQRHPFAVRLARRPARQPVRRRAAPRQQFSHDPRSSRAGCRVYGVRCSQVHGQAGGLQRGSGSRDPERDGSDRYRLGGECSRAQSLRADPLGCDRHRTGLSPRNPRPIGHPRKRAEACGANPHAPCRTADGQRGSCCDADRPSRTGPSGDGTRCHEPRFRPGCRAAGPDPPPLPARPPAIFRPRPICSLRRSALWFTQGAAPSTPHRKYGNSLG